MFIVIEVQTNDNGKVGVLTSQFENQLDAESKFHQALSYAAIGTLPKHSAFILSDDGYLLKAETYTHAPAVEESEEEPISELPPEVGE